MKKDVFFFELKGSEEDLPPLYANSLSEIEGFLKESGYEILNIRKEVLEEGKVYRTRYLGFPLKYGFVLDGDELLFLYAFPYAMRTLERLPSQVRRGILERSFLGEFLVKRFERLRGFRLEELVADNLYIGLEW